MIQIKFISNMNRFFRTLERCKGDVILHLPDDSTCNLSHDKTARQLLDMADTRKKELSLSLTNAGDFPLFLSFMLEAAC